MRLARVSVVASPSLSPSATPEIAIEYHYPSINELAATSEAAVIATVTGVTEPRWNSEDDEPFSDHDTDKGIPARRYRESTLRVQEVLWDTPELDLVEGDAVELFVWGDGTQTGARINKGVYENNVSGPIEVGARMLAVLTYGHPFFKAGREVREERRVMLFNGFLSRWTLEDGRAISALPERSAPERELIDRLLEERARGHRPDDRRGRIDPLER